MLDIERRYTLVPVELRANGERRSIGGYASVFNRASQNLGGFIEQVMPTFFNKSHGDGWPDVLCRYNHDDNMLLGTTGGGTLRLQIDETGLHYEVDPPAARQDVMELVQRGDVRKSSFAMRVHQDEWTQSDQGYPLRSLHTGQLVDVAPVNIPAYADSSVGLRSLAKHFDADFEEVRKLASENELRRFFVRTDGTTAKKELTGVQAMVQLMERRSDPWEEDV